MKKFLAFAMFIVLGCTSVVAAQTVDLAWNAVADADLASYVFYRGVATGTYNFNLDVGNVLATSQTVPLDCTNYFFAMKAKDTAGNLSATYSNEVSGWARVRIATLTPSTITAGTTATIIIAGANFQPGVITSTGSGLTWGTPTITNCNQVSVSVTASSTAATGARDVDFMRNSDRVFGVALAGLTVTADTTPPSTPTNLRRTEARP